MQLSSPFNIQLNYVPDNILMHAIENFLHNMCYQCSVHCKFYHVPCYCHDCHAWTVQLNNCAAVNELAIVQYFIRCSNIHNFAIAYWRHPGTITVMMLSVWQIFIALLELKLKDSCTDISYYIVVLCVTKGNYNKGTFKGQKGQEWSSSIGYCNICPQALS